VNNLKGYGTLCEKFGELKAILERVLEIEV
jgi:hypothetical protein